MKMQVFVLKPNMDEARINTIIRGKIDKFMEEHKIVDQQVVGYSDDSIAVVLFYTDKKSK